MNIDDDDVARQEIEVVKTKHVRQKYVKYLIDKFGLDLDKFDAPFLYEVCHFKAIPLPEFIEVSLVWVWVVCVRDDRSLGSSLIMVDARL